MNTNIRMRNLKFSLLLFCSGILMSCEKNINVDIPKGEDKLVVEGWIEPGLPPFIILTKSAPYFDATSLAAFESSFVNGAAVEVNNGTSSFVLTEYCTKNFTDVELQQISVAVGIPYETLKNVNYCLYTNLALLGEVGKNYSLKIVWNGNTYTSETQIPSLVQLDSVWFKLEKDLASEGLGFAYGHLTDPDTLGNGYRWQTKRLGADENFLSPIGSAFEDKLINGKSFEFGYDKPHDDGESQGYDGYFKIGDTIVVKFSTIDKAHYEFLSSYENFLISNGNPFASPTTIKSNIKGNALGVWGGYGVTYDTIYAK